MFFLLSKTLDLLISPIAWTLALLVLAAFARTRRAQLVALGSAFALLAICSAAPVANALLRSLEAPPDRTYRDDVTYDAVIVLGGFIETDVTATAGAPAFNDNVERLLTTFDLLRTGHARFAILSGAPDGKGVVEADEMAKQLEAWGIDKDRLLLERTSRNTRENAVESAKIARDHGFHDLVLVTSAFHMPRAHGCFRARDVALPVDTDPVDFRSYDAAHAPPRWRSAAHSLEATTEALHEWLGRAVYRMRGYSAGS